MVRGALPTYTVTHNGFDRVCLTGGGGNLRVAYASTRLLATLSAAQRIHLRGRADLILTANAHYALDGIRPGVTLSRAKAKYTLGSGIQIGKNTWYFKREHDRVAVLKVQHGTVEEVGIATKALAGTPAEQRRLLTSFRT